MRVGAGLVFEFIGIVMHLHLAEFIHAVSCIFIVLLHYTPNSSRWPPIYILLYSFKLAFLASFFGSCVIIERTFT